MPVAIKGTITRKSARAFLFQMAEPDNGGLETFSEVIRHWIPFSQAEPRIAELVEGTEAIVSISDWIAGQKNIRSNVGVEENLERFEVERRDFPGHGFAALTHNVIDSPTGDLWCMADERKANMIAAALNLTQGKV